MMGTTPGSTPTVPGEEAMGIPGEEEMAGAEELASPAGREMRESQYSRKLGIMLAQSKKK